MVVAGTARVNSSGSGGVSALRIVYKGSTPDARGLYNYLKREHPLSFTCTPLVHSVHMNLAGLRTMEMPGGAVGLAHIPARSVCRQRLMSVKRAGCAR